MANAITQLHQDKLILGLPANDGSKSGVMAMEIKRAAELVQEARTQRNKEIQGERSRAEEIEKFIKLRAKSIGLEGEKDIKEILGRITPTVD